MQNWVWLYDLGSGGSNTNYVRATVWHPVEMRIAPVVSNETYSISGTSGTQSITVNHAIFYMNSPSNIVSVDDAWFNAEL